MVEYLDRDKIMKILQRYSTQNGSSLGLHSGAIDCAMEEIERVPTADVEPVRHEHWVPIGEREIFRFYGAFDVPQSETKMEYSCSTEECWIQTTYRYPFCPGCGAKMDGRKEK